MTARQLRQVGLAGASEMSHGQPLESLQCCEPSDCVLCTTWRSPWCFFWILVNPTLGWILSLRRWWFDCSPYRQSVLTYSVQTLVSVSCPVFVGSMLCWHIQVWVWLMAGMQWLCKTWEFHVMCIGWLQEPAWHCFSPCPLLVMFIT